MTPDQAEQQLNANIQTLSHALGAGALTSTTVNALSTGPTTSSVALDAVLNIASTDDLTGHFGDIIDGLQTGLVGGTNPMIEGLAVQVDVGGVPEIGAWESSRADSGDLEFNPSLNVPGSFEVTVPFTNITNGPTEAGSAIGLPTNPPRKTRHHAAPATHHRAATSAAATTSGGGASLVWILGGLVVAGALAAGINRAGIWPRRRSATISNSSS